MNFYQFPFYLFQFRIVNDAFETGKVSKTGKLSAKVG